MIETNQKLDTKSNQGQNTKEVHVEFRKRKRQVMNKPSSIRSSLRSSYIRHTQKEEDIFAPNLHVKKDLRDTVKLNVTDTETQENTIDSASSFLRAYRVENGHELKESNIVDAAVEDHETTTTITSHNKEEKVEDELVEDNLIASVPEEPIEEESEDTFNPVIIIFHLPKYSSLPLSVRSRCLLPPKCSNTPKYTLVLDLDETLVHCTMEPNPNADLRFPIRYENHRYFVYANIRPFFFYLLKRIAPYYEIIVFTASQKCYADPLLDILDSDQHLIDHRLYRDSCLLINDNYVKDLNVLNRDLSKTVIVDNYICSFGYHIDNGIPIISWFDDKTDHELYNLSTVLMAFLKEEDIRPSLERLFHLKKMLSECELVKM